MSKHYDFIVIGGGSAGYAAARTAHEHGKRVAIVDGGPDLGGLCILRGCMPSKTLIYSAELLHLAQHGKLFGLDIPEAKADMPALHARKLRTIAEFAEYRQEQLQSERFSLYRAQAQFVSEDTISLDNGETLSADGFLVATGSVVNTPPIPGLDAARCWTSDDVLELDYVPESVIVLGGGVVACELAQFLARIGTSVTQIQRSPQVLKEYSHEAAQVVETAFRDEGIELITDTQLEEVTHDEDGVSVRFRHGSEVQERRARHLFNALGRRPATDSLALDKAGVTLRKSGHIQTNAAQQSSNPRVYAAGDCAGPHEIVHVAIMQGECAAKHFCLGEAAPVDYAALTSVVFTDPQLAHVGLDEQALADPSHDVVSASFPFDDHGKSILMEAKYGYVKAWAERGTGQVLAAQCVGKDASELIHAMAVAVTLGATVRDLLRVHWYHPTLAEIWSYPLEDILEEIES